MYKAFEPKTEWAAAAVTDCLSAANPVSTKHTASEQKERATAAASG